VLDDIDPAADDAFSITELSCVVNAPPDDQPHVRIPCQSRRQESAVVRLWYPVSELDSPCIPLAVPDASYTLHELDS